MLHQIVLKHKNMKLQKSTMISRHAFDSYYAVRNVFKLSHMCSIYNSDATLNLTEYHFEWLRIATIEDEILFRRHFWRITSIFTFDLHILIREDQRR